MEKTFYEQQMEGVKLNKGEVRIIGITPTKNKDMVQLIFVERVDRPGSNPFNDASMQGHENWNVANVTPVWHNAMLTDLKVIFPDLHPVALKAVKDNKPQPVSVINPVFENERLKVQITESHTATKGDLANLDITAKQDGEGNYLSAEGKAIFVKKNVIPASLRKHTFITHDSTTRDVDELQFNTSYYESDTEEGEDEPTADKKKSLDGEEVDA